MINGGLSATLSALQPVAHRYSARKHGVAFTPGVIMLTNLIVSFFHTFRFRFEIFRLGLSQRSHSPTSLFPLA